MLVAAGLSALTTWYFTQPDEVSKVNDSEIKRLSNELGERQRKIDELNLLLEGMSKSDLEKKYAELLDECDGLRKENTKLRNGRQPSNGSFITTCVRDHPWLSTAFGVVSAGFLIWVGHYFWTPATPLDAQAWQDKYNTCNASLTDANKQMKTCSTDLGKQNVTIDDLKQQVVKATADASGKDDTGGLLSTCQTKLAKAEGKVGRLESTVQGQKEQKHQRQRKNLEILTASGSFYL